MNIPLSPSQRKTLQKVLLYTLCGVLFFGGLLAAPHIAAALPTELAYYLSAQPPAELLAALRAEPNSSFQNRPPETVPEQSDPMSETTPSPPAPPENALTVFADSFCWYEEGDPPTLDLINGTDFNIDLQSFLEQKYPISVSDCTQDEPLVLIMHTHGSESYLPNGTDYYLPDEDFRSDDPSQTVIAVGDAVANSLQKLGISVIHDTAVHDAKNFNNAYTYAREAVKQHLKEHPSIRYVLDIHRDSINTADGICSKTLTVIDQTPTAQVMLVVGTDQNGAAHADWRKNLTVATHLQALLGELYPTLARPINLRADAFNQALSKGALLVEIGSCGNTVEEACTAGRLFAAAFASLIKTAP